ncbi:MAG: DNA cytosine methyltransferase [Candidatus Brocadiales bacterium]|nr:DNA cytosine methyltransferase [Candidatus Bathyanammoxibius sp.]
MLNVLGLCFGIGGIELGLHRTGGFRTVCYVEKDPWCVATTISRIRDGLLCDAPIWTDLKTFNGGPWRGVVDCITSGFPCQPVSVAGKRLGEEDERWLWPDILRVICEVRPRIVLLENVPGLLVSGLGRVLGDLAESGYDCQWDIISAESVGAPHFRNRLFLVAHPTGEGRQGVLRNYSETGVEAPAGWPPTPFNSSSDASSWLARVGVDESPIYGNGDGLSHSVDRLRALGNAVVPQVAEAVGYMILEWIGHDTAPTERGHGGP